METSGWIALTVAAIGAVGSVVLQALHMYLSYKRDMAIKEKVEIVARATNGLTEKIVTAELTAERVVSKAADAAKTLLTTATVTAHELKESK
jgi:hypothetical protein